MEEDVPPTPHLQPEELLAGEDKGRKGPSSQKASDLDLDDVPRNPIPVSIADVIGPSWHWRHSLEYVAFTMLVEEDHLLRFATQLGLRHPREQLPTLPAPPATDLHATLVLQDARSKPRKGHLIV